MYHDSVTQWKNLLQAGLEDDGWQWDWTSRGIPRRGIARARVVAKSEGIWADAGLPAATELLARELGGAVEVRTDFAEGAVLKPGQVVCRWKGPAPLLLALERPFLNLASYAGGIALRTRRLTDQVKRRWKAVGIEGVPMPRVTSTRKTLPAYRDLAVGAVIAGGGSPHRISLSGGILIKENHIAAAGGIGRAVRGVRAVAPHGLKVEIEVRNARELDQALRERVEVVMLDNFSPEDVRRSIARLARERGGYRPMIEVSGGIDETNIDAYVQPGVDVISIGSLTHSVKAVDLSMLMD